MPITIPDTALAKLKGLGIAALVAVAFVAGHYAPAPHWPRPKPKPDVPAPPAPPAPKPDWFGSNGLQYPPGARQLIAGLPRLSQAAPHLLVRDADTRPVLLYKAWLDLFDAFPPYRAQEIGDCTSFATGHSIDLLECIEFVLANPGKVPGKDDIQETSTEAIYAVGREAGGMLGFGDGCYGGAIVKGITTTGLVSRRMLGTAGPYSGRRAKQWGRTGLPDAVRTIAAKYKLGDAAQVETWDELVAAISAAHPVIVCSNQGFTMRRDAQGFCAPRGHWSHCMAIAGVRHDREGALILQSWGPETPSGPTALGQPSFSFWADRRTVESMLAAGDSYALSSAPKFGAPSVGPARKRRIPARWRAAA